MLLISFDISRAQFFQNWNWGTMGNGDWKQGTGNYIVYFHEQREYLYPDVAGILYVLVRLLTLYFVSVLQIFCQYLRHSYLSTYFLSRIVHLYKILVELYFIERIFFLSPLVHFECLVVDSVSHNIPRRCNPTILEKCFHHVST